MAMTVKVIPPKGNAVARMTVARTLATRDGAQHLLESSSLDVPVLTGRLRDSGRVTETPEGATVGYGFDDGEYEITGSSGDDDAPVGQETAVPTSVYAVEEHEDLQLHHPNGGNAKWLEIAMHRDGPEILGIMAESARKAMGE